MDAIHFSSQSNEWATPQPLFDALNREFDFTLDPCATPENAKCGRYFTARDDGLSMPWAGESVFMNPPYGRAIGRWVEKACSESLNPGTLVVCLLPARTDTRYWHEFGMRAREIRLIRGRLRFGGGNSPAPFPSCLVIFCGAQEGGGVRAVSAGFGRFRPMSAGNLLTWRRTCATI